MSIIELLRCENQDVAAKLSVTSVVKSPRVFVYPDGSGAVIFYRDELGHLCVRGYLKYYKNILGVIKVECPYDIQDNAAIAAAQRIYGRRTMRYDNNLPISKRLHLLHNRVGSVVVYYGVAEIKRVPRSDAARIKVIHGHAVVKSNNSWSASKHES